MQEHHFTLGLSGFQKGVMLLNQSLTPSWAGKELAGEVSLLTERHMVKGPHRSLFSDHASQ